jgi:hypothetical protein
MTRLRKRVATRLKDSQNTFALLTTFNEIDMTNLMDMRAEYKDAFQEKHGVKLGFMSGFVKVDTIQHFSCHIRETHYAIVFSMYLVAKFLNYGNRLSVET